MEERTLFIKPTRPLAGDVKLDPVVVTRNKMLGIETSLSLDTNILIHMEKVVLNGNTWSLVKKRGLHNFVKLLQRCPPHSICISPGLAFNEMPPHKAERSRVCYEIFCATHLPGFIDSPNSVRVSFDKTVNDYSYEDLSDEARAVMSVSFSCIAYLNVVENMRRGTPIEKFKCFLDLIEKHVDFLSAAEVEIAKYCFAELRTNSQELVNIRKKIRNNFLKTRESKLPTTARDVMQIAFNGASDLQFLMAANLIDSSGLGGVKQDAWIATRDKKFAEFCSIFHHVNLDGDPGKFASTALHSNYPIDPYWLMADAELATRTIVRRNRHLHKQIDLMDMLKVSEKAIADVRREFA